MPDPSAASIFVLDGSEFYEESSHELTRLAVEQFLDWEEPPPRIVLHRLGDGRWAVEAFGGRRDDVGVEA